MDGEGNNHFEKVNPVTERQRLHVLSYMWMLTLSLSLDACV